MLLELVVVLRMAVGIGVVVESAGSKGGTGRMVIQGQKPPQDTFWGWNPQQHDASAGLWLHALERLGTEAS